MALLIFLPAAAAAVVKRESGSAKDGGEAKEEWHSEDKEGRRKEKGRDREIERKGENQRCTLPPPIRLKQQAIIKPRPRRGKKVCGGGEGKKLHAATKNNYAAEGRRGREGFWFRA